MIADQSFQAWKGILCSLYAAALITTGIRIVYRVKSHSRVLARSSSDDLPFQRRGHHRQSSSFSAHSRVSSISSDGRASRHMRTPSHASSRESAKRKLQASWLGLGCDDLLAIIASALGVVAGVVLIFLYQEKDSHERIPWQKALYWTMVVSWVSIIWLARIGLVVSLYSAFCSGFTSRSSSRASISISHRTNLNVASIGQEPTDGNSENKRLTFNKRFSLLLGVTFFVFYSAHLIWTLAAGCTHYGRLREDGVKSSAYCNAEREGANIFGFVATFSSELALIGAAYAFHRRSVSYTLADVESTHQVQGHSGFRTTAVSVAVASVLMLFATIIHCSFLYSPLVVGTDGFVVVDMAGQFQAVLSIIGCNVPVLVQWFRWSLYGEELDPSFLPSPTLSKMIKPGLSVNVIRLTELSRDRDNKQSMEEDDVSIVSGESVKVTDLPPAHAVHDTRFPNPKRGSV